MTGEPVIGHTRLDPGPPPVSKAFEMLRERKEAAVVPTTAPQTPPTQAVVRTTAPHSDPLLTLLERIATALEEIADREKAIMTSAKYEPVSGREANRLLAARHYLGPIGRGLAFGQRDEGRLVAVMVWTNPTSRRLPQDRWLELARWCLTPEAGQYAGSRMHGAFVRWLRRRRPEITTLVSYSDPSQGHTGAVYKASNWQWRPTWHRLRPPPTGNGAWTEGQPQSVKDRWIYVLGPDPLRDELLRVKDAAIVRRMAEAVSA